MTAAATVRPHSPTRQAATVASRIRCQAKTVCVPFVNIDGDSYRMRQHQARNRKLTKGGDR
jgi:hypothetical protein